MRTFKKSIIIASVFFANISAAHDAQFFETFRKTGQLFCGQGKLEQAAQQFDRAIAHLPKDIEARHALAGDLLQLGIKFFNAGQGKDAVATFRKILCFYERSAAVHHNLAFSLAQQLGKHQEALKHYRRALKIKPKDPETHFCYALSCLALGKMREGWREYKFRWKRPNNSPRKTIPTFENEWTGQNLKNKTICIRCEQGLGDMLQFIRYAQHLKNRGALVIAEVQKPLVPLLSLCEYIDQIIIMGDTIPSFDYQIPLLDLPARFDTTLETIPSRVPYLYADTELEARWRTHLQESGAQNFKIGICWYGDAVNGKAKFMPLKEFAPLMNMKGVRFYSLQKFSGLDQLDHLPQDAHFRIFNDSFDKDYGSFMDSAAVMKSLDLVITADTSVAHLAGGLGVRTWVVLPFPAEWRWLTNRNNSPWYPTMQIFRQKKPNDWSSVQQELLTALKKELDPQIDLTGNQSPNIWSR